MSNSMEVYTIGWICAVGSELVAATAFLDEMHDESLELPDNDNNTYTLGRIGKHNIVIAALPHWQYGLVSAATVARDLVRSFPNVRIGLMVGIGGGAPSSKHDIRLGDIVVSSPGYGSGGVLQYDYGKTVQDGKFILTGYLSQPPQFMLTAMSVLKAQYERDGHNIEEEINRVLNKKPRLRTKYRQPDPSSDRLYVSSFKHAGGDDTDCAIACDDTSNLVQRAARTEEQDNPTIHFGLVASANQLMKDAIMRDKLSAEKDVLCFEMEAAGLMNQFPCVIIRGICDYSDTHKNENWQGYAAMAAAAYAKDLLCKVAPNKIKAERRLVEALDHLATNIQNDVLKINSTLRDQSEKQERRDQSSKDQQCLQDLYVTDASHDKRRIEEEKGGLIEDCYSWILEHDDFKRFQNDQKCRLLWIKGDPGKGKTMLLCGVLDQIQADSSRLVSYFFCTATDGRINTSTSVLRGLIYTLVKQNCSLLPYVKKRYESVGKALFEDANAWQALSEILMDILQDIQLRGICLVVDALDECVEGLQQLLDLIVQTSQATHAKWLVSSRNWLEIDEKIHTVAHNLSLELNADSVSAAVKSYINFKVSKLSEQVRGYDEDTIEKVRRYLSSNADNTFLWVALVCGELAKSKRRHMQVTLESFPPGLNPLYQRMMEYIAESRDAEDCYEILALASTVYRPVSVDELQGLIPSIQKLSEYDVKEVIASCGSFLSLRDNVVSFVHQSAKDFLRGKASDKIFSSGILYQHSKIFSSSLDLLKRTLRRDIYELRNPGYPLDEVETPRPDELSSIRYSCVYWADHFEDAGVVTETGVNEKSVVNSILGFMENSYLYWLEALSLMHNVPEGVKAMEKLDRILINSNSAELRGLVKDAYRFVLSQKKCIEVAPLQTYISGLVFCPVDSLIKRSFQEESSAWLDLKLAPNVETEWNACLQTLDDHTMSVESVAISTDGVRVASGSHDKTLKLWDAKSGDCLQTLEGHKQGISSIAISTDSQWLASGSYDTTIKLWNIESHICLQTLEGHKDVVTSVAISTDSQRLISGSRDGTLKLWNAKSRDCLQTLQGHTDWVTSVAISRTGEMAVSGSHDGTVKLWNLESGACARTLDGHKFGGVGSVAVSTDGRRVLSGSHDKTLKLWDAKSGACLRILEGHANWITSVAISRTGEMAVSGSHDGTVKLWDLESGACLQTLNGHIFGISSVVISTDGRKVISGSHDQTLKIWDARFDACLQPRQGHRVGVNAMAISNNHRILISGSQDNTIKLWNVESGICLRTLEGHSDWVTSVAISISGNKAVSGSHDGTVKLWDIESGACLKTLEGHTVGISSVVFATNEQMVASGSHDKTVKLWKIASGACLQTFEGHVDRVISVAISTDGQMLVSGSDDKTLRLWDSRGACLQTFQGHTHSVTSVAISSGGKKVASGSYDTTIKLWRVESGACLQTVNIGRIIHDLSFDPSYDSRLLTDIGEMIVDIPLVNSETSAQATSSSNHTFIGHSISADGLWILHDGDNLIWLPVEYRPTRSKVAGSTIAIGCASGRVWFIRFARIIENR